MEYIAGGLRLRSDSPEQTRACGRLLGARATPGLCLGLIGELGAGKTAFAAGLGVGLGVTEALRSPSYLLCCEYAGRLPILHLDAYFEARMESLLEEGLAARFTRETVPVIEWADRLAAWWPADRLELSIRPGAQPEERELAWRALGPRAAAWLEAARAELLQAAFSVDRAEPPPRESR